MLQHFIFTCPQCGSDDLCRVERTLAYRKERHIVRKRHEYLPGDSELMDLEYESIAGLQCARCRYPDTRKGSFRWKSWQDLEQSGCLASDPNEGKEKVSCMVCALDGHIYRTRSAPSRRGFVRRSKARSSESYYPRANRDSDLRSR